MLSDVVMNSINIGPTFSGVMTNTINSLIVA